MTKKIVIFNENNRSIKLTNDEWNAISKLTSNTHLDQCFDVHTNEKGEDGFMDYEEEEFLSIEKGLVELYDGLAYPLSHEDLNEEEAQLIVNLFQEFKTTEDDLSWLLKKENEI